jgi:hypothetical protein
MNSALSTQHSALGIWLIRLLLAALLAFGSEVLLWTNPTGRPVLEWLFLIPGYIALSAILLDFIPRYRANDIFGLLVLAGIYGLGASLLLNPQSMLADMPRTLVTRVMGAHAQLAAQMLLLLRLVTGGERREVQRWLLVGCGVVGLAWGIWVRWWPVLDGGAQEAVPLTTMLALGGASLALLIGLLAYTARRTDGLTPDSLRLARTEWGVVSLTLLALFGVRMFQSVFDGGTAVIIGLLLTLCWAILWFRGRSKGRTLLDGHLPIRLIPTGWLVAAIALFVGVSIFAYNLPLIQLGEINQQTLIGLGFTAYGLAWLPTVSLRLGLQAYLRQIEASRQV